jgi:hypothetical protein
MHEYEQWLREPVPDLGALLRERYGRSGDLLERGYGVSFDEAACRVPALWWVLHPAKAQGAVASFLAEHIEVRLDLLLGELLDHPDERASVEWARRYGYSTPSAAGRGLRSRYRLTLGDVRRVGRVGQWLAHVRRHPRAASGKARWDEARMRIDAFRSEVETRDVGPHTERALATLGTAAPDLTRGRPRYPRMSAAEANRIRRMVRA